MTAPHRSADRRVRRVRRAVGAAVVVIAVGVVASACTPAPPKTVYDAACDGSLTATTPGTVANGSVVELSGLVASRRNAGVWWVHNDSGSGARNVVYAVGDDGRDLGAFTLTGTVNVDWEDIAVGPGPAAGTSYLYVADIGNNINPKRNAVDVYRVAEPAVSATSPSGAVNLAGATKLTFTYPGGATPDAEALLVDPADGGLFVVTKVTSAPAQVYKANLGTSAWDPVATVPWLAVTAADVTAAGDFVALRTYGSVQIYPRPAGQSLAAAFAQAPCAGATAAEVQGEAIGFTPDGRGYVTASEGAGPALHQFHAP
jgi:hypothetical protein